jgi:hypothetical protein
VAALSSALDRLYADYNREDSAADPVNLVRPFARREDREVAGFCAAALAFGRVASVLASISTLFHILGDRPADYVRSFDPSAPHPELYAMVHRWTRGRDLAALLWILRQMLEHSGSVEKFFAEGWGEDDVDVGAALDGFSRRALALDVRRVYGLLLLSPALSGQRLQAAEPVLALDGAQRRRRPGCLADGSSWPADRSTRHSRHPPRPVPAPHAVCQSGLANGGRHHQASA